jgi:hypothetical protein
MISTLRAGLAGLILFVALAQSSAASSPDAWEAFQKKVAEACTRLALAGDFAAASAEVDPFGTETYGLALVSGKLKSGREERALCAFDKKTGKAELGGESANWVKVPASGQ